jgi:imidazoleglycerol phosphate synthase glutamine amidotransferase subunit HisH
MKKKIVILDYKVGNFSSLKNTIQQLGHDVVISNNKIILNSFNAFSELKLLTLI